MSESPLRGQKGRQAPSDLDKLVEGKAGHAAVPEVESMPETVAAPKVVDTGNTGINAPGQTTTGGVAIPGQQLKKAEEDETLHDCLQAITQQIGYYEFDECSPSSLQRYVCEIFDIDKAKFAELLVKKSHKERHFVPVVCIKLVSAHKLVGKDTNGTSDPYAILRLVPSNTKVRHDLDERDLERQQAVRSSIVHKTCDPEWNEEFEFVAEDPRSSFLVIDVWDFDPKKSVGSTIKGIVSLRNVGRMFKETVQHFRSEDSDDFLGFVDFELSKMPALGSTQTEDVKPRSSRSHVSGSLTVEVTWKSRPKDQAADPEAQFAAPWNDVSHLHALITKLVHLDARDFNGKPSVAWPGKLGVQAEFLIHQFALQQCIASWQTKIARFCSLVAYHIKEGMMTDALLASLRAAIAAVPEGSDSASLLKGQERDAFEAALVNVVRSCEALLANAFSRFRRSTMGAQRLSDVVNILQVVSRFWLWNEAHPGAARGLKDRLKELLTSAAQAEFERIHEEAKAEDESKDYDGKDVVVLVRISETLQDDLGFIREIMQQPFNIAGIDVWEIVGQKWSWMLSPLAAGCTTTYEQEEELSKVAFVFRLFFSLRALARKLTGFGVDPDTLEIHTKIWEWFFPPTVHWLDVAGTSAANWVAKAVELDELKPVAENVYHSTSVLDIFKLLNDLWQFWERLAWPDTEERRVLVQRLTYAVCCASEEYAKRLSRDAEKNAFYDLEGPFDFELPLCLVLNNIMETRSKLMQLSVRLARQASPASQMQFADYADNLSDHFKDVLHAAARRTQPHLVSLASKVVFENMVKVTHEKEAWTRQDVMKAAEPLLDYLQSNILKMSDYLYEDAFGEAIVYLWRMALRALLDVICPPEDVKTKLSRLSTGQTMMIVSLFTELFDFFYQDGAGIDVAMLKDQSEYKALEHLLALVQSPAELIIDDFMDAFARQVIKSGYDGVGDSRGRLTLQVTVKDNTITLDNFCVNDLPPMDSNGMADPFLVIEAYPHGIVRPRTHKTSHQRKTLNAKFDDKVVFKTDDPAAATIRVAVYDYDRFSSDDFIGETFVVPKMDLAGGSTQEVVTRAFLRCAPAGKSWQIYRLLERRANAKETAAVAFVKDRKSTVP